MDEIIEELLLEGENLYLREETVGGEIVYITNYRIIITGEDNIRFSNLEDVLEYGFLSFKNNIVNFIDTSRGRRFELKDTTTCIDFLKELSRAVYEKKNEKK